jgi:hypothetical protein
LIETTVRTFDPVNGSVIELRIAGMWQYLVDAAPGHDIAAKGQPHQARLSSLCRAI